MYKRSTNTGLGNCPSRSSFYGLGLHIWQYFLYCAIFSIKQVALFMSDSTAKVISKQESGLRNRPFNIFPVEWHIICHSTVLPFWIWIIKKSWQNKKCILVSYENCLPQFVVLVFYGLPHFSGHFGHGQLTYPHCSWASLLGSLPVLSAHSFASNWQLPFLNQRKGENGGRNYFMTNLHKRMLPDVRIEPATVRIPGGCLPQGQCYIYSSAKTNIRLVLDGAIVVKVS